MNFVVSKLNRDFTLHLVACDEAEQKFLESHIGEIVELSSRPTMREPDASPVCLCPADGLYPLCPVHRPLTGRGLR